MAPTRKMEHLWEWKEIACLDNASEEHRPKVEFLEMFRYPHLPQLVMNEGTLDDLSMSDWLAKDLQLPFIPPKELPLNLPPSGYLQAPSGGQRLLIGMLPFSNTCLDLIREKLALPEEFLRYMTKKGSPSFKVSTPEQSGRSVTCFIFTFRLHRPGYYQLALSYDRETGLTHGLLLAMTRKGHEIPRLLKGLRDRLMFCEQPLILAALVAELVIDSCATKIESVDGDLNALEEESGLHGYDNRARGDPLRMDFMRAIQILHFSNRTLGLDTIRLQYTIPSLIKIVMETKKIATQEHDRLREIGRIKNHVFISDGRRMVEELADTLKQYSKNQLLRAKYEENRLRTQLTVVSRLMAQKDTKVNIEMARVNIDLANDTKILARASKEDSAVMRIIAVETRKDSSSMKTIAILGMLFLPSTFLASLFQGPMMSWDAKGRPVTTAMFKYFCAIAVSLTLLFFSVWVVATLLPWEKLLYKRRRAPAAKDSYSLEHIASHSLESG